MAKLLLYATELHDEVDVIAATHKIGTQDQKSITTLEDFAKTINSQKNLEELIIFAHGFRGGIMLDEEGYALDDPPVKNAFAKTTTKIEHIRFEGCWVGEAPNVMATFAAMFDAKTVSGFTWVHWLNRITIGLKKGNTAAALETALGNVKDTTSSLVPWIPPPPVGPSLAQLASRSSQADTTAVVPLEWFQYGLEEHPPYEKNNLAHLGRHTYKVRTDANKITVKEKDAQPYTDPIPPFDYVTVEMTPKAATTEKAAAQSKSK